MNKFPSNDFDRQFDAMQRRHEKIQSNGMKFVKVGIIFWILNLLFWGGLTLGAIYVVIHFLLKFW